MPQMQINNHHILYTLTGSSLFLTSGFLTLSFLCPFAIDNSYAITERTTNGDYYIETTATDLNLTIHTTPAGAQETASNDITVKTNDPAGYTLTVSVDNDISNALNLNGNVSAAEKFNATSGTYASPTVLDENSWGFADTLAKKNNDEWAAVPLLSNAQQFKQTSSANTSGDATTIYYGINAKYDGQHSNGNYSNTIVYSVTGNTIPVTYMQDMTASNCAALKEFSTADVTGTTYEVTDSRDQTPYYIRKFTFGSSKYCTMVENLNLAGGTTVTYEDTNITSSTTTYLPSGSTATGTYTLPASDTSGYNSNDYSDTSQRMYDGNGRNRNGATYYNYAVDGAYYNWQVATAGTGGPYGTDRASSGDICPKNWRLFTSSEYSNIVSAINNTYGINNWFTNSDGTAAASAPVYSGSMNNSALEGVDDPSWAIWWSSAQYTNNNANYIFADYSSLYTNNYGTYSEKFLGFSVRCLLPAS